MGRLRFFMVLLFSLWIGTGVSSAEEAGKLLVDRFTKGLDDKGIPVGWTLEKTPGQDSKIALEREKDFSYLHLRSSNDNFGLKKEISFDIRKYPFFSWKWRVRQIPKDGDIRKRETDDQAGQIYVVFPKFPALVQSRSVGYIWDSQAPAGLTGISTAYSKMRYVILQSATSKLNQWIFEARNVYEDYKKLFEEEPPQVGSVLIYINSQHTKGSAEIDYTDIFFSASSPKEAK